MAALAERIAPLFAALACRLRRRNSHESWPKTFLRGGIRVLTEYSSSSHASKGPLPLERFWRTKGHCEPGTSLRRHLLVGVLPKTRGEVWVKIPMLSRARNRRKSADAFVLVRLASSSIWS